MSERFANKAASVVRSCSMMWRKRFGNGCEVDAPRSRYLGARLQLAHPPFVKSSMEPLPLIGAAIIAPSAFR